MKKTMMMVGAILLASVAQAFITDISGDRGATEAYVDRGGSFNGIQNGVKFYGDSYVSFEYKGIGENSSNDLSAWGDITFSMYTINLDGGVKESIATFSADGSSTGSSMDAGSFLAMMQAGELVGFSISNGSKTIYSTPGIDGAAGTRVVTHMENGVLYIGFFVDGYRRLQLIRPMRSTQFRFRVKRPMASRFPACLPRLLLVRACLSAVAAPVSKTFTSVSINHTAHRDERRAVWF